VMTVGQMVDAVADAGEDNGLLGGDDIVVDTDVDGDGDAVDLYLKWK
jgi:hypothetical protein